MAFQQASSWRDESAHTVLISDILSRHAVTTQKGTSSWIALKHFEDGRLESGVRVKTKGKVRSQSRDFGQIRARCASQIGKFEWFLNVPCKTHMYPTSATTKD